MDSDKILLLDAGEVSEFDHPRRLLMNVKGNFHGMVAGLGEEQFEILKNKTKPLPPKQ